MRCSGLALLPIGISFPKLLHMIGKVASFYYDTKRQDDEWNTIINEEIYI